MTLQPHQQRVVEEHRQVFDRLAALSAFLGTERRASLPFVEQELLRQQHAAMADYERILRMRLSLWGHEVA